MKTIDEVSKEYAENKSSSDVFKESHEKDFKAGVEFAQRWIPVEEELPPLGVLLQVKGIAGKGSLEYDFAKFEFRKGLCNSHLIKSTHWRPIEIK